jgi:hypothetical protein
MIAAPPPPLSESTSFAELDQSLQLLVFQTIQEAITANPPRPEATFERVEAAYLSLSQVVGKAARGLLNDDDLARLERDVDAAGGVIAPGLVSQGDQSLNAFRAATFGMLRQQFSPAVGDAACQALNACLNRLQCSDAAAVFQAIAVFFGPLMPAIGNSGALRSFHALDASRQVAVFDTISSANAAVPLRSAASFEAVVAAYQAEAKLLRAAASGCLSRAAFEQLQLSIARCGGVIAPNLRADGPGSIAEFCAACFAALDDSMPAVVVDAAITALNVKLKASAPDTLEEVIRLTEAFIAPLRRGILTAPATAPPPLVFTPRKAPVLDPVLPVKANASVALPSTALLAGRGGLLHSPAFYAVASNLLFWGLPLGVVHLQGAGRAQLPAPDPGLGLNGDGQGVALSLSGLAVEGLALTTPPPAVVPYDQSLLSRRSAKPAPVGPLGLADPNEDQSTEQLADRQADQIERPDDSADPLPRDSADALGGPITLASLNEPRMPAAARAERLAQQRSGDPLAALPHHWRGSIRRELGPQTTVSQAGVVRLPVRAIKQRQEVPVIVKDNGHAEGLVLPQDPRITAAVEEWVKRQAAPKPGTVQVVIVAVEPLDGEPGPMP